MVRTSVVVGDFPFFRATPKKQTWTSITEVIVSSIVIFSFTRERLLKMMKGGCPDRQLNYHHLRLPPTELMSHSQTELEKTLVGFLRNSTALPSLYGKYKKATASTRCKNSEL